MCSFVHASKQQFRNCTRLSLKVWEPKSEQNHESLPSGNSLQYGGRQIFYSFMRSTWWCLKTGRMSSLSWPLWYHDNCLNLKWIWQQSFSFKTSRRICFIYSKMCFLCVWFFDMVWFWWWWLFCLWHDFFFYLRCDREREIFSFQKPVFKPASSYRKMKENEDGLRLFNLVGNRS